MAKKIGKYGLICCFILNISLWLCSGTALCAEKLNITFGGGSMGSATYVLSGSCAEVLKGVFPDALINVEPGGASTNAKAVEQGKIQIGITSTSTIFEAWEGNPPFNTPHRNLRVLCALMPLRFQLFATKKSGIKQIEDIQGKNYCPALPGQASYTLNKTMLKIHGMTFDSIKEAGGKVRPMGWSELLTNMSDGHIDASAWYTTMPNSWIMRILNATDGYLVGWRQGKLNEFLEHHPAMTKAVIPPGSYEGQKNDVLAPGAALAFVTSIKIPEEVMYKIAKTIWDNRDYLAKSFKGIRWMTKETIIKDVKLQVHPGALKFYKEIGVPEAQ